MTVAVFTLDDLQRILISVAGADEGIDLDGESADTLLTDLGYDSLALLETAAVVSREYGVTLDDEAVTAVTTPRGFVGLVNDSA
ncbi:acyl carrier protein [Streptomyces sp. NPDC050564]|uniref:acyl carrier protein n=1 Tax=Streptomyces sp. NPDC050564 TaxID=3365631 RepID=UPI0037AD16A5